MINHIWSVICTKSVIDSETNNISLIDTIERLTINLPTGQSTRTESINLAVNFEIVSLWERHPYNEPTSKMARIRIMFPDGNPSSNPITYEVNLNHHHRMRSKIKLTSMEIRTEGRYLFLIGLQDDNGGWSTEKEVPLEVVFQRN